MAYFMKKSRVQSPKSKAVRNFKSQSSDFRPNSDFKPKTENQRPKTEPSRNLIFGMLPVLEALRANARRIEKIFIAEGAREHRVAEIIDLARAAHVLFQKVTRESLAKLIEPGANHQGVVAFTASADYADADALLGEIVRKENPLVLILDGVEDPRNLG